jgi:hypothetical protein
MGKPPVRKNSAPVPDDDPRLGIGHNGGPPLAPVAPIPRHSAPLNDLAASVGVPGETLEALSRKGKGPPIYKIGRRIFARIEDFHEWLDDVATGKIDATLHPSKRRRLGIVQRDGRPRGESRPAAS